MKTYMKNNKVKSSSRNGWGSIRSLTNESGAALVVALLLMVVMITMIPVAMQLSSGEFDRTENFQEKREAFFIAEAGMERLKSIYINVGSINALSGPDGDFTTFADNGTFGGAGPLALTGGTFAFENNYESDMDSATHDYTKGDFNGGDYKIRFWDNDDSGLCPATCSAGNADPILDTNYEDWVDRDGTVYAESIGISADGTKTTLYATLRRPFASTSKIPAAMTLVGPEASYRTGSNAGKLKGSNASGKGFGISGAADPDCIGKEGLAIEGENTPTVGDWTNLTNPNASQADVDTCSSGASNVCLGWSPSNSQNDVDGATGGIGNGIVVGDNSFTALDAEVMFDTFVVNNTPDQILTVASDKNDVTSFGTATNPVVIHAQDDLDLNSGVTGYGVLVVDGNLNLGGTIIWNGIVIISGCDDCEGWLSGSGGFEVNGSVIIGNDGLVTGPPGPTVSKSTYGGQPNYNYSCEGIDIANGTLTGTYLQASWNELGVNN
jgi:hypothetical protein